LFERGRKSPLFVPYYSMLTLENITALAQERIDELACEIFIVDITISSSNSINVELDKMGKGVSINECTSVSRNIEHNLDREVADFSLQVSSAGMDRPLRVPNQFIKNTGRQVKVILNHGSVEGMLKSYEEGVHLVIETETKEKVEGKKKKEIVVREHILPFTDIKEVKRVITFK
jgi:ribosome maturation factor RimP